MPILEHFVGAFSGSIDCVFWNSMIKRGAMAASNGSVAWYSGWVNVLFPVIGVEAADNRWCEAYSFDLGYIQSGLRNDDKYGGIEVQSFPTGLSMVNARVDSDLEKGGNGIASEEESMRVVSGFVGYTQNQLTCAVEAVAGWFVVDTTHRGQGKNGHGDGRMGALDEESDESEDALRDYHRDESSDLRDSAEDEEEDDGALLMNVASTTKTRTTGDGEAADDGDEYEDGSGSEQRVRYSKNKGRFMPLGVADEDEEDDLQKELQRQLS